MVNKGGRPTVVTKDVLRLLREAFAKSFTDDEACLYAGIGVTAFYGYCRKDRKFAIEKELLKKRPNIKAKENWIEKIEEGDYNASKEWLERKSKSEFSTRTESQSKHEEGMFDDYRDKSDAELYEMISEEDDDYI